MQMLQLSKSIKQKKRKNVNYQFNLLYEVDYAELFPTRTVKYALVYLYVDVVCQFLHLKLPLNEQLYSYAFQIYGVSTAEAMDLLEHFLAMNPDNE
jgi:hypothetical protein